MKVEYLKGDYLFTDFNEVWEKINLNNEHPEWFSNNQKTTKKTKQKKKEIKIKKFKEPTWKDCENDKIKSKMTECLNNTLLFIWVKKIHNIYKDVKNYELENK